MLERNRCCTGTICDLGFQALYTKNNESNKGTNSVLISLSLCFIRFSDGAFGLGRQLLLLVRLKCGGESVTGCFKSLFSR